MENLFVELHFKCVIGIYCSPNLEAKLIIYSSTSKFMHIARTFKEYIRYSNFKGKSKQDLERWSSGTNWTPVLSRLIKFHDAKYNGYKKFKTMQRLSFKDDSRCNFQGALKVRSINRDNATFSGCKLNIIFKITHD